MKRLVACCLLGITIAASADQKSEAIEGDSPELQSEVSLLQAFSGFKHSQWADLAGQLELDKDADFEEFFRFAMEGDWNSVSNVFSGWAKGHNPPGKRANALWPPVHETYGAYEEWNEWQMDSVLLSMFYEPILKSIPEGSIYFGGSDPGRFLITTVRDAGNKPDIVVITQNALADRTYADYLEMVFGEQVWMPKRLDQNKAFKSYVEAAEAGEYGDTKVKIANGKVKVEGVADVMRINGILAQMIFDQNKADHNFFIEESYVIPWMFAHMEPHGLIFKLNNEPLDQLPEEVVKDSLAFWDDYTRELLAVPTFAENLEARKSFSKLRSANAGLMAGRHLYTEAEHGFRQALKLYPSCTEAHFRLAEMYKAKGDQEMAVNTMEDFLKIEPESVQASAFLKRLRKMDSTPDHEQ